MNPSLLPSSSTPRSRRLILALFVLLFVLHHDFWAWNDRRLVLGFLPLGLWYHALFSVTAGVLWALANRFAWPDELERWANQPPLPVQESAAPPAQPATPRAAH